MTERKFTDEQIIEALEVRMPHDAICCEAYDLINRQRAEIERLKKLSDEGAECPTCHGVGKIGTTNWLTKDLSKKQIAKEKAESVAEFHCELKAEAIKEFAARLKERFFNYYEGLNENTSKNNYHGETLMFYEVADMIEDCIENLVEEMTEGKQ